MIFKQLAKCPKTVCAAALKRQSGNQSSTDMYQKNRTQWIYVFLLSYILTDFFLCYCPTQHPVFESYQFEEEIN